MTKELKRREFIRRAGILGAAAIGSPWMVEETSAAAPRRKLSPNEKLNIAWIGAGGQASSDIASVSSENIVALCDVDDKNAAGTYKQFPNARKYKDYREMLEKEDRNIDAVGVTIPDHNHAAAACMAMRMGKHVYCQKPLSHSIAEAQVMLETARRYRVVTQMGTQGHPSYARTVEFIQKGVIGPVHEVHVVTNRPIWPQGMTAVPNSAPVPSTLDWDLWLGVAAERPYAPGYLPFVWRGWWDFGTGALGDMGCHLIDGPFWALNLTHPTAVWAESDPVSAVSPPKSSVIHYEFPARGDLPPVKMHWYDGGRKPPSGLLSDPSLMPDDFNGSLFVGEQGMILVSHGDGPRPLPVEKFKDYQWPAPYLYRSPGHYVEWINACKGVGHTSSNFGYAVPLTQVVLLGNLALRMGQRIEWDASRMRAIGLPSADEYIHYHYRKGWRI